MEPAAWPEAGADIAQDVFAEMSRRWEAIERPAVGTDQVPVGAVVWVVDVTDAGLPRGGADPGLVDRVVLLHDTETGEAVSYFESAVTSD